VIVRELTLVGPAMKILYLSLRFPYPPHSGDKIRTYNILKHLSQRHDISFVSFVQSPQEASCTGYLREYCDQVKTVEFSKLRAYGNCLLYFSFAEPFQVGYWHSQEMQQQVDEMMDRNSFDIIHVQFFRMAQYVTKYTRRSTGRDACATVLDSGDSFSLNLNRRSRLDRGLSWPLLKVEANRVRMYETEITQWFDQVTMVSSLDRDYLLSINGSAPMSVVPMGVDLEYYQPSDPQAGMPVPPNLLFTGTIRYFPNKDAVLYFCNEILPLVKNAVPSAKFYVVGNHPPKKISKLMSGRDVIVTGRVEDVRPYFARSAVFVCPLRSGSGMQTKILEAMAMGVPVVTTSMGAEAFEEAIAGRDIIIADDARKFAAEIICLLKDKELRQSVAQNARELVQRKYGWSSVVKRLDMIYETLNVKR